MSPSDFDLFVLGTGPAGQRAAIQAAMLGKRAGIADQRLTLGGVCINTGTIPSETLRESARHAQSSAPRQITSRPNAANASRAPNIEVRIKYFLFLL